MTDWKIILILLFFSSDTAFPLEPGKNEKRFGCLKFENAECPCEEYNSKAPKTYE